MEIMNLTGNILIKLAPPRAFEMKNSIANASTYVETTTAIAGPSKPMALTNVVPRVRFNTRSRKDISM